jgi:hypothetical protein
LSPVATTSLYICYQSRKEKESIKYLAIWREELCPSEYTCPAFGIAM